jgi:hypothetical protein
MVQEWMFRAIRLKGMIQLQWLQDPSNISGLNQNNVRYEAWRYLREIKKEYL